MIDIFFTCYFIGFGFFFFLLLVEKDTTGKGFTTVFLEFSVGAAVMNGE